LLAHHRQYGTRDVHRPEQQGVDLLANLLGAQLLEEASVEVARVVDQDIDSTELGDCCGYCSLCILNAGDIELETQQVLVVADGQ
jgi:hypothetical protein